ncbi:hypothetical protein O0L34_g17506 [Tuta absoluta]|nr:hypothetical protein O0L34_g17506 [Tuta absoluta]
MCMDSPSAKGKTNATNNLTGRNENVPNLITGTKNLISPSINISSTTPVSPKASTSPIPPKEPITIKELQHQSDKQEIIESKHQDYNENMESRKLDEENPNKKTENNAIL